MARTINPLTLIITWILFAVIVVVIIMLFLAMTTSGGEQKPLSFLGAAIPVIVYGILAISIATVPFFREWMKSYWYVNLIAVVICVFFIVKTEQEKNANPYFIEMKTITSGGKEYEQTVEYYDAQHHQIRSISFYSQGKKDSTWSTFSSDGQLIKREVYRAGTLIN